MANSNYSFKRILELLRSSLRGEEHDFTQGSLKVAIFLLAIPMILELSLESVFAVVDIFFVSKLGQNAIAVVAYTESMITIIYSVAIGISTAATALVARRIGEKDHEGASKAAMQTILIGLVAAVIMSAAGALSGVKILRFMGASDEVIAEGLIFTTIMFSTSTVIVFLFLINGIFRGAGNASLAMKSLWIASLANIILDPLLIYGFLNFSGFGLKGAAIATSIGRGLGVAYQLKHLFKGEGLIKVSLKMARPDWPVIGSILKLSWPATFQFIIASGSWIILTKIIAETGGTTASAAYQIAIRNLVFFILPAWGLSNAAATLVGQNLGANQLQRAQNSVVLCMRYNIFFMIFVTAIFIFASPLLMRIFSDNAEIIRIGSESLRIMGAGFIFYGIGMVMIQALNGAGDTTSPTLINFAGFWLFQIPLAYFLTNTLQLGINGAVMAIPIAETFIALAAWYIFSKGKWKTIKI